VKGRSYQILMEPQLHASLKNKANLFSIKIGEMLENLLLALDKRVMRIQLEIEEKGIHTEVARGSNTEKRIVKLILKRDVGELTERQFKGKIRTLIKRLSDETVAPEQKLKGISDK
jgi:hypothetical protein